jgi:hypothetical protein
VTGTPGADPADPSVILPAAAYTLLSSDSREPTSLSATDTEAPFQPLAVLGMVQEAEAVQKAAKTADAAAGADTECVPMPKPKMVSRTADTAKDSGSQAFTEQVNQEKKRIAPAAKAGATRAC